MKKLLKYAVCLAILLIVMALMTGCVDKATGGGWFYDCKGVKCTFGFNAQEKDNPGAEKNDKVFTGQFQFQVTGKDGTKFHLDEMTWFEDLSLFNVASFGGYDKDDNWVSVTVTDMGEPGAGSGDGILIVHETLGAWAGVIDGGNIQLHETQD